MTQEEKARAYDEALEQAAKELNTCGSLDCDAARQIFRFFPQLAASENERTRKEILNYILYKASGVSEEDEHRWVTWLEKQKEQKPAWSEEDEAFLKVAIAICNRYSHKDIADWLKSLPERFTLQPKQEWSEEDRKIIQSLILEVNKYVFFAGIEANKIVSFLKSLHPQLKQVWTEEDDRICHLIMANLSESARHAITLPMETVNDFNSWLRTLQCMPPVFTDWNEEDQTLLSDALGCVTMVQELKKRGELKNFHISCSYDELRSWVRSLKSRPRKQPQWKPSEEQLPGIEENGVPGKDFIPVEWVDACEKYGKWKIVQQEQKEVDLEKEIEGYIKKLGFGYGGWVDGLSDEDLKNIARYFYELGLKAK